MNETAAYLDTSTADDHVSLPMHASSALQSKNVRIHNRRTSVRLEPRMWTALNEIAVLEGCSIHDLCGVVYDLKTPGTSFTAALRVFMMEYYRTAMQVNGPVSQVQKVLRSGQTA